MPGSLILLLMLLSGGLFYIGFDFDDDEQPDDESYPDYIDPFDGEITDLS